eukprot:scaffold14177_cov124-Isochrysis_galbana.AAC.1
MSTDVRLTKRYKKSPLGKKKLPCMHTDRQQQQAATFFGLDLPVGDRELDRDFRESEGNLFAVLRLELFRTIGGRENGPRTLLAVVENVGLGVHPLEVEEEIGDRGAHVRVADLAERRALLLDGDEVIGVGDEVGVIPFIHCLLLNGRRRWWGLAFALLRRGGVERAWVEVCERCTVCLWLSRGESSAGCGAVLSAPEGCTVVVEGGVCSFVQNVSGSRVDAR